MRERGTVLSGRCSPDTLSLRAGAAEIDLPPGIFDEPFVKVVADLFALVADKVDAFDRFVDLFPVEDAAPELLNSYS